MRRGGREALDGDWVSEGERPKGETEETRRKTMWEKRETNRKGRSSKDREKMTRSTRCAHQHNFLFSVIFRARMMSASAGGAAAETADDPRSKRAKMAGAR